MLLHRLVRLYLCYLLDGVQAHDEDDDDGKGGDRRHAEGEDRDREALDDARQGRPDPEHEEDGDDEAAHELDLVLGRVAALLDQVAHGVAQAGEVQQHQHVEERVHPEDEGPQAIFIVRSIVVRRGFSFFVKAPDVLGVLLLQVRAPLPPHDEHPCHPRHEDACGDHGRREPHELEEHGERWIRIPGREDVLGHQVGDVRRYRHRRHEEADGIVRVPRRRQHHRNDDHDEGGRDSKGAHRSSDGGGPVLGVDGIEQPEQEKGDDAQHPAERFDHPSRHGIVVSFHGVSPRLVEDLLAVPHPREACVEPEADKP
mmetsp:Transcript_5562/g.15554  ORF Transcript_5562/g.15554 Transcript_5562/m.15554 type:complete len:313 (-) Transcript_5562:230-1168(-)